MSEDNENSTIDLIAITSDIVAAHVANNRVAIEDVPGLITSVYKALADLGEKPAPVTESYEPAVTVRKSLASDSHIISMIDGKPYTMLKRHLSQHDMTPAQYRERYNLPSDYPMTSKSYSQKRRGLALSLGLGQKGRGRKSTEAAPAPAPVEEKKPRKARQSPVERLREAKAKGPFGQGSDNAEG